MQVPRTTAQPERLSITSMIVMGGWTQWPATTASTDIIDAERRSVVRGPEMNVARADFASVTMPNGAVVVLGGYTDGYEKSTDVVEVLEPGSNAFRIAGHLSMPRGQLSAIVLDSESVLVVGGREGITNVTNRCEIFYPRIGAMKILPSFPYETSHSRLIRTIDNNILAFSGRSGGPGSFRAAIIHQFDPATEKWLVVGRVADSVWLPTITELPEREYLWTGGSFRESNGPQDFKNTIGRLQGTSFVARGSMIVDRVWHGGVSLSDSMVIVIGGSVETGGAQRSTELIDPRNGTSMIGPACLTAHAKACVAGLDYFGRRTAIVAGGDSEGGYTDVVEMLLDDCINGATITRLDSSRVTLHGAARYSGPNVVISGPDTRSAGSIWMKGKISYDNGFVSTFVFRLSEGDDRNSPDGGSVGADGIAMVIQSEAPALTGVIGLGIGYDGLPHGLAVEFDSYHNDLANDPDADHVAIQVGNGIFLSSQHAAPFMKALSVNNVPRFVADGRRYFARVQYAEGIMRVWVDTNGAFESPVIELPLDLNSIFPSSSDRAAYFGLTSATGNAIQLHELESWTMTACQPILVKVSDNSEVKNNRSLLTVLRVGSSLVVRTSHSGPMGNWMVCDGLGRRLLKGTSDGVEVALDLGDLPSGVYYFIAQTTSGTLTSTRLIK